MIEEVRNITVDMKKANLLLRKIAKIVERSKPTILRVLNRYDECGFVKPTKNLLGHKS